MRAVSSLASLTLTLPVDPDCSILFNVESTPRDVVGVSFDDDVNEEEVAARAFSLQSYRR